MDKPIDQDLKNHYTNWLRDHNGCTIFIFPYDNPCDGTKSGYYVYTKDKITEHGHTSIDPSIFENKLNQAREELRKEGILIFLTKNKRIHSLRNVA